MKICVVCKETKTLSEYNKDKLKKDGLCSSCRECSKIRCKKWADANPRKRKDLSYRRLYGITIEEYEKLCKEQNGLCKICEKKRKLYVDHCHNSKQIRGLLCQQCNTGLGHFGEQKDILQKAIEYLRENHYPYQQVM